MKIFSILLLMLLSYLSYGAKIVIMGPPVVLEQRDNVYFLPATHVPVSKATYMYVTINGVHRVCFLHPEPSLVHVNATQINVEVKGSKILWNCYPYNTSYFEARP